MKNFTLLVLSYFPAALYAWEGTVFSVSGKDVVVYSNNTAGIRTGARLYVVQKGKVVGEGWAGSATHSAIKMKLTSGAAGKGNYVTDKKPQADAKIELTAAEEALFTAA